MKLLVSGPRAFTNEEYIHDVLDDIFLDYEIEELISGGAVGVDSASISWANKHNIPVSKFKPEYEKYGNNPYYAPLARNEEMAKLCDYAVVFWSGVSPKGKDGGTLHTMRCLAKEEKNFTVIGIPIQK
jgi:hypothetical protein